jgi:hypothetical protein
VVFPSPVKDEFPAPESVRNGFTDPVPETVKVSESRVLVPGGVQFEPQSKLKLKVPYPASWPVASRVHPDTVEMFESVNVLGKLKAKVSCTSPPPLVVFTKSTPLVSVTVVVAVPPDRLTSTTPKQLVPPHNVEVGAEDIPERLLVR